MKFGRAPTTSITRGRRPVFTSSRGETEPRDERPDRLAIAPLPLAAASVLHVHAPARVEVSQRARAPAARVHVPSRRRRRQPAQGGMPASCNANPLARCAEPVVRCAEAGRSRRSSSTSAHRSTASPPCGAEPEGWSSGCPRSGTERLRVHWPGRARRRSSGAAPRLAMACWRTYLEARPARRRREPMCRQRRPQARRCPVGGPAALAAASIDRGCGACVERGAPRGGVAEWLKAAVC